MARAKILLFYLAIILLITENANCYKGHKKQSEDSPSAIPTAKDLTVTKQLQQEIEFKKPSGSDENYFKENNYRIVNLKSLNVSKVDFYNMFDPQSCEIVSPCKPCSFRELQKWPECQSTGYRFIKKCDEIQNFSPLEGSHETGSSTVVCFPETEELLKKM